MQKLKLQIIIICLSIFSFFSTKAQYNRGSGEAYFNKFDIAQTAADGDFLWFGTYGAGLYKYDVKNNTYSWFNTLNSDIPSNVIYDVKIDKSGFLWLSTDFGLVLYDRKQWTLFSNISPKTIAIDNNNKVWVGTAGKGVYSINNTEIKHYDKLNSSFPTDSIYKIAVDGNNKKWFSTKKGLVSFDEKNWTTVAFNANEFTKLAIDKQNTLWVTSSNEELYRLETKGFVEVPVVDSHSSFYSTALKIQNIVFDETNTLYMIGYNPAIPSFTHLWKYANNSLQELPYLGYSGSYYDSSLSSDKNNNIWLDNNDGLLKLNNNTVKVMDLPSNIYNKSVGVQRTFAIDKNNQIWVNGNDKSLYFLEGSNWKSVKAPSSLNIVEFRNGLTFDSFNNKWFITSSGIIKYDGNKWTLFDSETTGLSLGNLTSLCMDKNNTLWVGDYYGNLYNYDGKTWVTINTKVPNFPQLSRDLSRISQIVTDNNDNIWLVTPEMVMKLNIKTFAFATYTDLRYTEDIAVDSEGTVWAKNTSDLRRYKNDKWEIMTSTGGNVLSVDTQNNIWVSIGSSTFIDNYTTSSLFVFKGTDFLNNTSNNWHNYITNVKFDSKNNLWYDFTDNYFSRGVVKLPAGSEKVAINSSSTNKVIGTNETTNFLIKITGNNLSLQWQVNKGNGWLDLVSGTNKEFLVSGEKTNKLRLDKCSIDANNFKFRCKVTDEDTKEIIYSTPVNLAIYGVFAITNQLENKEIFENESITYNVTTTGRNNVNYQWQVKRSTKFENLTPNDKEFTVKGEKTADLTLSGVKLIANNLTVRCLANSLTDTLITNSSKITVKEIFAISQSPQSSSIFEGGTANFEITASKDTLSYLWQYKNSNNWVNLSSTTNNYFVEGLDTKKITLKKVGFAANGLTVRCIVSNKYKYQLTSGEAILTVTKILANEEPNEFSIFPNPVTQSYLNITDINNVKSYSLINSQGMEILCGEVSSNVLQIGNLKSGIYILQLKDKKGIAFSKKLIISQ